MTRILPMMQWKRVLPVRHRERRKKWNHNGKESDTVKSPSMNIFVIQHLWYVNTVSKSNFFQIHGKGPLEMWTQFPSVLRSKTLKKGPQTYEYLLWTQYLNPICSENRFILLWTQFPSFIRSRTRVNISLILSWYTSFHLSRVLDLKIPEYYSDKS